MSRHCLTEIDLEARTALCSVGPHTEIHVSQTENPPAVCCVQGARERQEYVRGLDRKPGTTGRSKHILWEIDEKNRTGVCAICGPTTVYQYVSKGYMSYRCATYARAFERQKRGAHLVNPYARVHILSDIDKEKNTYHLNNSG